MKTQITCPACEHSFDIEDVLAKDLEKQIGDRLQNVNFGDIDHPVSI